MSWMIVTKQGDRTELPDLFAFEEGVWMFPFFGDETYIDPFDSSVWTWEGVTNNIDEILVIIYNGIFLIRASTLADCKIQNGSFFWDDINGYLYVHWFDFGNDYYFARPLSTLSQIVAGYANGYSENTHNVYDSIYYSPKIVDLNGFTKKVDLIKLGLITFEDSSFALTDQINERYQEAGTDTTGIPLWVYLITKEDTELTDDKRIFTGIYNGYNHDRESQQYNIIETRFFQNTPVCPNTASVEDYPNIGDKDGEIIPVAWGQLRRGRMLLTNEDSLTEGVSGTAIFLVSDPALGEILAVSNVYDESGEIQIITGTDLTACTVDVTKPAGVSPGDMNDWTYEGQGYDISGDYNNGLDIIKAAYGQYVNISFTNSTFDEINWINETAANPQAIGISIKSEKGFVEELIEAITTSLQGIVEILGDGRISWASRDLTEIPIVDIPIIKAIKQITLPGIKSDTKDVVSELQLTYAPNFKTDDKLSFIYTDDKADVLKDYGIDRREPLSPVDTVLVDLADVEDLAVEIMSTSNSPLRKINVQSLQLLTNIRFFQIAGIDTGTFDNPNIEYGELLSINPDYNEFIQQIEIRVIPGYSPLEYQQGEGFSDLESDFITDGFSDLEIDNNSSGFGVTEYS